MFCTEMDVKVSSKGGRVDERCSRVVDSRLWGFATAGTKLLLARFPDRLDLGERLPLLV
jgi:hypothetical protein